MDISVKNNKINTNYMMWLESYISKYGIATIKSTDGETNDKNNLNMLSKLYEGVKKYAENNYVERIIMNHNDVYSQFFHIEYNNKVYQVGYYLESDFIYFCKEVVVDQTVDVIPFDNLQYNKELPTTQLKSEKLKELSDMIKELAELRIPYNSIAYTTNDAYVNTKSKRK